MPIISVASFKGGVAKTTTSIALGCLFSNDGSALVIDSDPNRNASLWGRSAQLPCTVCTDKEAPRLMRSKQFDWLVIDTQARPSPTEMEELANGCDLLIIPCPPDSLSISTTQQVIKALPPKTNYQILITMIPPPPQSDGAEALEALKAKGFPVFTRGIRSRKVYKNAVTEGKEIKKVKGGGIAWRDWTELKPEILKALK